MSGYVGKWTILSGVPPLGVTEGQNMHSTFCGGLSCAPKHGDRSTIRAGRGGSEFIGWGDEGWEVWDMNLRGFLWE